MPNNDPPPAPDITSVSGLFAAAKEAHPSFRWATAVAGICALVAVVSKFGLSPASLIFGVIIFIALMFLFLLFARAAELVKAELSYPVKTLVWSFVVFAVISVALLLYSVFYNSPLPLRDKILKIQSYANVNLRVYAKPLEALGEVPTLLNKANKGTRITFMGIHFAITTEDLDNELLAALLRGVSIRYIVLASSPEIVSSYCAQYDQSEKNIGEEVARSFLNLRKLMSDFQRASPTAKSPGTLEIRVLSFSPAQRVYWFDYGSLGAEAIVMQYAMGVRSSDSPAMRFDGNTPLGELYETSLKWHWGRSTDLANWKDPRDPAEGKR